MFGILKGTRSLMMETVYGVQSERLVSAAYQMYRVHLMVHAVCWSNQSLSHAVKTIVE